MDSVNPYDFFLCYSPQNVEKMFEILTDISGFLKKEGHATKLLSQVINDSTGINIMYHSIWSVTLPTCHFLPPPTVTDTHDTDYAAYIKFLVPDSIFKSKMAGPPEEISPDLYLVSKDAYDPSKPPFPYELFNRHRYVYPDVFWF